MIDHPRALVLFLRSIPMRAFNYDILKSKRKRAGDPETPDRLYPFNKMAERMGFEPMMEYNPHTRLAG